MKIWLHVNGPVPPIEEYRHDVRREIGGTVRHANDFGHDAEFDDMFSAWPEFCFATPPVFGSVHTYALDVKAHSSARFDADRWDIVLDYG